MVVFARGRGFKLPRHASEKQDVDRRARYQGPEPFVLRARVVLIVLVTIGALTAIMSVQSLRALNTAYHQAGRSELRGRVDVGRRLPARRRP